MSGVVNTVGKVAGIASAILAPINPAAAAIATGIALAPSACVRLRIGRP